ncbi:hypothetical protein K1719_032936 [Acacia pycnantha]|nr:hypothetical protein K1719_032936 [Acacia pycnantha]
MIPNLHSCGLMDIGTKSGERESWKKIKTRRPFYSRHLFDGKTKAIWVNKKLDCNCFMIYAKSLAITWVEDPSYWKWEKLEESSGTWIEIAELKEVCWLDVRGKLDTRHLSPGVIYGVYFHVMLKTPEYYSWSAKVSVNLKGLRNQEHEMNFREMLKDTWMEIPVGQFVAPAHDVGAREMEFCLWNHSDYDWKRGLIVKGASIEPL